MKLQYISTGSITVLYPYCSLLTSLERQRALWIQPNISEDLGSRGFALKAMPACERSGGGGGWEDISEQIPTLLLTVGLPQWRHLICPIDQAFSIFVIICMHMKKTKDYIFPKLPCRLGPCTSHMLRPFLRRMPHCGQRDTAKVTDGQHRERTDQDACLRSTRSCRCAHKYRTDGAQSASCKVPKYLKRGPWKCVAGG